MDEDEDGKVQRERVKVGVPVALPTVYYRFVEGNGAEKWLDCLDIQNPS